MNVDADPVGTVPYLLGSINAKLDGLHAAIARTTERLDRLEVRTDELEATTSRASPWVAVVEKMVWGVLGAAGVMALRAAGLV